MWEAQSTQYHIHRAKTSCRPCSALSLWYAAWHMECKLTFNEAFFGVPRWIKKKVKSVMFSWTQWENELCSLEHKGEMFYSVLLLALSRHTIGELDTIKHPATPTHSLCNTSHTLIEHFYVSNQNNIIEVCVPPNGCSDHFPVCLMLWKRGIDISRTTHTSNYSCCRNFVESEFLADLNSSPWYNVYNIIDPQNSPCSLARPVPAYLQQTPTAGHQTG